jgi:hypothetical protein
MTPPGRERLNQFTQAGYGLARVQWRVGYTCAQRCEHRLDVAWPLVHQQDDWIISAIATFGDSLDQPEHTTAEFVITQRLVRTLDSRAGTVYFHLPPESIAYAVRK